MSTAAWSAYDEGYLRAYQWAGSLAAGAALPQEAPTIQLGPGEVVHAHVTPVAVAGYYGEDVGYRRSFLLLGGPVGLAVTGAASLAHNAAKKQQAEQAAVPRWHALGAADVVLTSQRFVITRDGQAESLWLAETGAPQWALGANNVPAIQVQAPGMPVLQLATSWAPLLYVFAHQLLDGRPPGVPLPDGLLDRARAEGRLTA